MGERAGHDEPTAQIVLDANGVDELELVRIGALSERVLHRHLSGAPTATLCDEENTPLAEVSLQGTRHLRPLAVGVGEAWHPNIRIASVDALTLGDLPFGFVAFQPPSLAEIAATASRARALGSDAILLFAAVSRATRPDGEVGPSGLVRAVDGAAERLRAELPAVAVRTIAVPWPSGLHAAETILRGYGVEEHLLGSETLPADTADTAASIATFPESSLREIRRAREGGWSRGGVILFTGLSGSGKSTIAAAVADILRDTGVRGVTLLDGDAMRRTISRGLGFDREGRNTNVERLGRRAAEVAQSGGVAIAAPIAPFAEGRARARAAAAGHPFLLVHVSTPLEVCEARDRKGLYARARRGEIADFTGVSSPYEPPTDADVVVDASVSDVEAAARDIVERARQLMS